MPPKTSTAPSPVKKKSESKSSDELSTTLQVSVESILNVSKDIQSQLKLLEEKEAAWNELMKKCEDNAAKQKTKIVLDVGGTRFATSKDTLLQHQDSYFSGLLRNDKWKPDEDGSFFVDRDPKHFGLILNFMRTGKIDLSELSKKEYKDLLDELDYYCITLPESLRGSKVSYDMSRRNTSYANINGANFSTGGGTSYWTSVFGKFERSNPGWNYWEVILKGSDVPSNYCRIGIANRQDTSFLGNSMYVGQNANSLAIYSGNTIQGFASRKSSVDGNAWTQGSRVGVAFNITSGLVRFYCNGRFVNGGDQVPRPNEWDPAFAVLGDVTLELVDNPTVPNDLL